MMTCILVMDDQAIAEMVLPARPQAGDEIFLNNSDLHSPKGFVVKKVRWAVHAYARATLNVFVQWDGSIDKCFLGKRG